MPDKKVQCPHCDEVFNLTLPAVSADQLTKADLEKILKNIPQPENKDHRHKTADEFLDCPECRLWFDKTAERYQIIEKKPGDKEPEPAAKPAVGSIFRVGGEHEQR